MTEGMDLTKKENIGLPLKGDEVPKIGGQIDLSVEKKVFEKYPKLDAVAAHIIATAANIRARIEFGTGRKVRDSQREERHYAESHAKIELAQSAGTSFSEFVEELKDQHREGGYNFATETKKCADALMRELVGRGIFNEIFYFPKEAGRLQRVSHALQVKTGIGVEDRVLGEIEDESPAQRRRSFVDELKKAVQETIGFHVGEEDEQGPGNGSGGGRKVLPFRKPDES